MTRILVFWDIMFACDSTSLRQSEGMCHLHLQGLAVQVTNSISSSGEDMVDVMHILPFCETAGTVGFLVAAARLGSQLHLSGSWIKQDGVCYLAFAELLRTLIP